MKFKFKNPLKKDQDVVIISNSALKDLERLQLAKEMAENSPNHSDDQSEDFDQSEEFERDEDFSRTETIDPIKLNKRRLDSLRQIYATLEKEEQEANLKLKILKKQEMIARKKNLYSEVMAIQAEKDKFYEEARNEEGYFVLKEDKWNDEYDEWLVKLARATNDTDRKAIQKELKKLEGIKSKNKTKNRMNKIVRGINKTTKTIGSITRGVGKFADEMGQIGNMANPQPKRNKGKGKGKGSRKQGTNFQDFFSDKKSDGKQGGEFDQFADFFKDKTVVQKTVKVKSKKKKKSSKKKKKSKRKSKPRAVEVQPQPTNRFENFFG